MYSDELRKYIDIINENSEEVLTEGMLQKLAGLALGAVLALGPSIGKADTIYSYLKPGDVYFTMAMSKDQIPTNAKVVFAVDSKTQDITVIKGAVKGQEVKPDPAAIKQGQAQPSAQISIDFNSILDQAKNNLSQDFFDPESAKFTGLKIYDTTTKKGDEIYLVTGKVNAKNRMGGYVGASDFYIALNKKDNSVVSKDTTDPSQGGQLYGALLAGKYKNAIEKGTLIYNNGNSVHGSSERK